MDASQAPGPTSSSDFVRKLYKMLEDPSYGSVVRWGNEGDSFVVLENEKFTKSILPKHFKHSNFASFVRQLNKYDFHKVRQNNEESGHSPYGPGAWEFKHPDFRADNKDALENIRRKAPVPKKPSGTSEEAMPTQQMDLVNTQLVATQSQLQQLHERYNELSMHHSMLLQEVSGLQKTVVNHEHVIQNVMNFLHSVDQTQRRNSRLLTNPFGNGSGATNGNIDSAQSHHPPQHQPPTSSHQQQSPSSEDQPASPLQNASKLLNEVNADSLLNMRNVEQMNEVHARMNGTMSTPPPSEPTYRTGQPRQSSREPPHSASSSGTMRMGDIENMVYPVGQNSGIDPTYSEHINNIPYPLPSKPPEPTDPRFQPQPETRKSNDYDLGWVRSPQMLLVEDDPTCRRIGGKFLYAFKCSIDFALDGLEAVTKLNNGHKYDLILMDIIMPNLDGVSACHLIRQFDPTPIIAMTSNIKADDISMYFSHGMNDVLPKPFTKDGLMNMLEKHLSHLKRNPGGMEIASTPLTGASSRQSIKDEDSPDDYMSSVRGHPGMYNMDMQYSSGPQTPSGQRMPQQQHQQQPPQPPPHRRHISDISGGVEEPPVNVKRQQQMYGQGRMPMHSQRP